MFRKDKKEGQPGIGLAKPCVSTRGPEALSQYTTGLPFKILIFSLHIYYCDWMGMGVGGGGGMGRGRGGGIFKQRLFQQEVHFSTVLRRLFG